MRHAGEPTFLASRPVVAGRITVADSPAICASIEDALNVEMAHLNIAIHFEPPQKAKQHGVPVV